MRKFRIVNPKRIPKVDRQIDSLLYPERDYWRPKIRADCASVPRPCPYVGCRHNLYLDVLRSGSYLINQPHLEPWELPPEQSCVLDVVEWKGPQGLVPVGRILNVTRERIRQLEMEGLQRLRAELFAGERL